MNTNSMAETNSVNVYNIHMFHIYGLYSFLYCLKHIVLKFIPQYPQSFFLYRTAVFVALWKYGHPLLTVELVAFFPHLVTQVTFFTHLLVFRSHDLTVFA